MGSFGWLSERGGLGGHNLGTGSPGSRGNVYLHECTGSSDLLKGYSVNSAISGKRLYQGM